MIKLLSKLYAMEYKETGQERKCYSCIADQRGVHSSIVKLMLSYRYVITEKFIPFVIVLGVFGPCLRPVFDFTALVVL
jgi:hypothetical protein